MKCRFCQSCCIKKGTRNKIQQYYCSDCGKYQRKVYRYASCEISDEQIISCVREGLGIRSTGRLLGISTTTVLKRIRLIARKIKKPPVSMRRSYEVDELYTFIQNKRKGVWIVLALEREANRIVDFYLGPRTQKSLRMVVNTLHFSSAKSIHTDGLLHYKGLVNRNIHRLERYGTNRIERFNLNLRIHLKRLTRRTIAYSKNLDMLNSCLTIYLWG
ncbi:MAG: IS1 family transposase [Cyclobacteriaceae bacterium]